MISVSSKPVYTSRNQKCTVYETTVLIEEHDNSELIAEFQAVLRSVLGSAQLKLDEAVEIAKILEEEAATLSKNVQRMMGGDTDDQDQDI